MVCNEYFLVTLESVSTPVRHKYTNLTDEWYAPDGIKYEDAGVVSEIENQATDSNRIGDNTIYQKLIDLYTQGAKIGEDVMKMFTSLEGIKTDIGDIKSVLDYINGEEV